MRRELCPYRGISHIKAKMLKCVISSTCLQLVLFWTVACASGGIEFKLREWYKYNNVKSDPNKGKYEEKVSDKFFPFRNTSLPFDERVDDLVWRLTVDEMALQIDRGGFRKNGPAPAIERLGIKPYNWNAEALHGYDSPNHEATCFPQAIGLAATFSKELIHKMAGVIALEARAWNNHFVSEGDYSDHTGLSCFAPVVNILRHPLWGRNQETYGEDPVLTSEMARAYISGLQGTGKFAAATSVCKHYGVHGGPENYPVSKNSFNAEVTPHDLGTTFLPAFRACVKSGAHGAMCSYNAINGVPACANGMMINEMLRKKFEFRGYVISDDNALEFIRTQHKFTKTRNETALAAKRAGVDLELTPSTNNTFSVLSSLVRDRFLEEWELRESVRRLFSTRMKLGEFNPPEELPWFNLSMNVVQSAEHRHLAEEVAASGFVLLKNDGLLPLMEKRFDNVTMIGPFANNSAAVTGDYSGPYSHFSSPTLAADWLSSVGVARVESGCVGEWNAGLPQCEKYNSTAVKLAVENAGLVLVTLGTGPGVEMEGRDRIDITLPGKQATLLQDVVAYGTKAKIVVLLFHGGPLDVKWALESPRVSAIISCHLPAQATGGALLRVLTGATNPAGRLPNTWPVSLKQVPPITNYTMEERTYRYQTTQPLFPFGYGLSFTSFVYNLATVFPATTRFACEELQVRVELENVGEFDGDEVIQIYATTSGAGVTSPLRQLIGFDRVHVRKYQQQVHHVIINPASRAVWKKGEFGFDYYLEPGAMTLYIGGQQPHQAVKVPSNILQAEFQFTGRETLLSECEVRPR